MTINNKDICNIMFTVKWVNKGQFGAIRDTFRNQN